MAEPDLRTGRIAIVGATIAGTVLGTVALVLLWLHASHLPPGGARLPQPYAVTIPGPALDSAPQAALQAYRAEKARWLHGRGWVDASQGIVRIPIEDAMALMAARAASAAGGGR